MFATLGAHVVSATGQCIVSDIILVRVVAILAQAILAQAQEMG